MGNFISFTQEMSLKPELSKEFLKVISNATAENLYNWFKEKCINIPLAECKKIITNKKGFIAKTGNGTTNY